MEIEEEKREKSVIDVLSSYAANSLIMSSPVLWKIFKSWCETNSQNPNYVLAERIWRFFDPDNPSAETFGKEVATTEVNLSLFSKRSITEDDLKALEIVAKLRKQFADSREDVKLRKQVYNAMLGSIAPKSMSSQLSDTVNSISDTLKVDTIKKSKGEEK